LTRWHTRRVAVGISTPSTLCTPTTTILNLNMPSDVQPRAVYQLIAVSRAHVPAEIRPCIASVLRERGHVYRHVKLSIKHTHAARSEVSRCRSVDLHEAHIIMIYTLHRSLQPREIRACTMYGRCLACYLHAVMYYCMLGGT
jgi:hypothetical protein